MEIFDIADRLARSWHLGPAAAGGHEMEWDGTTGSGRRADQGTYSVRVESGGGS